MKNSLERKRKVYKLIIIAVLIQHHNLQQKNINVDIDIL